MTEIAKLFVIIIAFQAIQFIACKTRPDESFPTATKSAIANKAMISTAHPLAAHAGVEILKNGGNAIDAMVATQITLAVVYPRAGNIGGGGFMVYRDKDGKVSSLDFREMAPSNSERDMFLDEKKNVIKDLSRVSGLSVGVPGSLKGLMEAHKKYGSIQDLSVLFNRAIQHAQNGFAISQAEADRLNKYKEEIISANGKNIPFVKDSTWQSGDMLMQTELAASLKSIAASSAKSFYEGDISKNIINTIREQGGIISPEDLKNYQAIWRKSIEVDYKNYILYSMPPPSSGGLALGQLGNILEDYPLQDMGFQSTASIHTISEAERRVFADRAMYLGDTDFVFVPGDSLLSESYLDDRMKDFSLDKASSSGQILAGDFKLPEEGFQTTHSSIIDPFGNAVSISTTLNLNYGSKIFVKGAGFFLNNQMDDFSIKPGEPNYYGLVGAEANAIEPNKRMLSSMSPTIICKDDKLFMVLGSPGGPTIITSVLQVFLNVAEYNFPLDQAIQEPRFHHQWLPDRILVEKEIDPMTIEHLKQMGHQIDTSKSIGRVKAIHVLDNGQLHGAGDYRNPDDTAFGF